MNLPVDKSSLTKFFKNLSEIMNSKCNLKNIQFPCKICRLTVNENTKAI